MLEPDGSPLFVCKPLAACRRFEPRKRSRTLALAHPGVPSSPLRDRVDCFNHDRFRGYDTVHFRSGLLPPCLRFAVYVTGHHARLGARLLARLCRGRHLRRLTSIRLQGATPTPPGIRVTYLGGSIGLSVSMQPGFRVSVIAKTGSAVRPQSVLEVPVLLAAPNRSGLRPSFPVRPICCSAFRPGVPH